MDFLFIARKKSDLRRIDIVSNHFKCLSYPNNCEAKSKLMAALQISKSILITELKINVGHYRDENKMDEPNTNLHN